MRARYLLPFLYSYDKISRRISLHDAQCGLIKNILSLVVGAICDLHRMWTSPERRLRQSPTWHGWIPRVWRCLPRLFPFCFARQLGVFAARYDVSSRGPPCRREEEVRSLASPHGDFLEHASFLVGGRPRPPGMRRLRPGLLKDVASRTSRSG